MTAGGRVPGDPTRTAVGSSDGPERAVDLRRERGTLTCLAAWTVDDVRAAEAVRLAEVPEGALMQTAAAGLATVCARVLRGRRGRVTGARVVLLVGGGNNGGDALWAGARLARRGAQVTALLTSANVHAEGLAALLGAGGSSHRPAAGATDGTVTVSRPGDPVARALQQADLLVDGLVGLGGTPGLREPALGLWRWFESLGRDVPVVAVDLPSGVDPDTGETPAPHVRATHTVTFGGAKPCLLLPPAAAAAGEVTVVDIGLRDLPAPAVERWRPGRAGRVGWPVPRPGDDKYRRGVLGVVAGSAAYRGAAVLVCAGALRAGVGMVRYEGPAAATDAVLGRWPEVVPGQGRVQAFVLGSGVDPGHAAGADPARAPDRRTGGRARRRGDDAAQVSRIAAVLRGEGWATHDGRQLPCVVDAGALAVLAGLADRQELFARERARARPGSRLLLTPHAGELATLLSAIGGSDVLRADVEARPWAHACRAADLTGATVLVKGSVTLVVEPASPDGRRRARSQGPAPSWLATAGSGDVLAGVAGALLAAGLAPLEAGSLAAHVHALAARGDRPVTAGALADRLPAAVAALHDPHDTPLGDPGPGSPSGVSCGSW